MRLWLDDRPERDPPPEEGWIIVRTPLDAIAVLLERDDVTEVSLDHDLGLWGTDGKELTGDLVLAWMQKAVVARCFKPPAKIAVHSSNPSGRRKMELGIAAVYRLYDEHCC